MMYSEDDQNIERNNVINVIMKKKINIVIPIVLENYIVCV